MAARPEVPLGVLGSSRAEESCCRPSDRILCGKCILTSKQLSIGQVLECSLFRDKPHVIYFNSTDMILIYFVLWYLGIHALLKRILKCIEVMKCF